MAVDRHIHSQPGFPEVCIFCAGTGPLTEEDWWPKWLHRYLPSPFNAQRHTARSGLKPDFESRHLGTIAPEWKGRGSLYSPLKVVCRNCNNRWMSSLQNRANLYLKPLIKDEWAPFDEEAQSAVASWMTMLCMVYDFRNMDTQNITQAERGAFFINHVPPSNWIISVGFLRNTYIHGKVWQRALGVHLSPDDIIKRPYNVQSTTIAIGKLLLHAFSTATPLVNITPPDVRTSLGLEVIWPAINWPILRPHRKVSNQAGFTLVAKGLDNLIASRL